MAGRPRAAQPAGRRDRQHAPHRALHRQALLARRAARPARPGRAARVRDAAARAHGCVQQLLVRALLAHFWETPYEPRLVRYGTQLHDRFMLPHFVEQDFRDVLKRARARGLPASIRPGSSRSSSCASRRSARSCATGIWLELRHALEPWHVLGEEQADGGAVRYVDSSLERLQVKVRGALGERFVVTCNGRALPLHPTGTQGERVAGVRYRAWQPTSCLHPTIPVARAAHVRAGRHLARALARRLHLPRRAPGRTRVREPAGERERSRVAARVALLAARAHAGPHRSSRRRCPNPDFPFTLDLRRS